MKWHSQFESNDRNNQQRAKIILSTHKENEKKNKIVSNFIHLQFSSVFQMHLPILIVRISICICLCVICWWLEFFLGAVHLFRIHFQFLIWLLGQNCQNWVNVGNFSIPLILFMLWSKFIFSQTNSFWIDFMYGMFIICIYRYAIVYWVAMWTVFVCRAMYVRKWWRLHA